MKIHNIIISLVGATILVLFLAPLAVYGILNVGNAIGISFGIIVLAYGLLFSRVNSLLKRIWKRAVGRVILIIVSAIIIAMLVIAVIISVDIISHFKHETDHESTVVVLGCRVREDGPSLMLKERINAAYEFLCENPESKCILSGGKGSDEPISEADCMYDYLVRMGIEPKRLIKESRSTSTRENLTYSKEIIDELGLSKSITLITNNFHQLRATLLADELDLNVYNYSAKTGIILLPTYFVREICGIAHYYFVRLI